MSARAAFSCRRSRSFKTLRAGSRPSRATARPRAAAPISLTTSASGRSALSSWEVAFNGAEPVRAETMKAFAEAFAPCGFRAESFRPCYGLAEATLLVSSQAAAGRVPPVKTVGAEALQKDIVAELPEGSGGARTLVSCGQTPSGQGVHVYRPGTFEE